MVLKAKQIQELYIAYFARPADPSGINYWLKNLPKDIHLKHVSELFSCQDEYKKLINSKLLIDFQINQFYINLFDRKANFDSINYWLSLLNGGTHQISDIVCDLIDSAHHSTEKNCQQTIQDLTTLENKVHAAELFTEEINSSISWINLYKPESLDPWIRGLPLQAGVDFLAQFNHTRKASKKDVISSLNSFSSKSYKILKEPILKLENVSLNIPIYGTDKRQFTKILISKTINSIIGGKLNKKDNQTVIDALKNINLTIMNGERVALIGHNGSGKSSFLRLISGIYSPTFGKLIKKVDVYPMLQKTFLTSTELSGLNASKAYYLMLNNSLKGFEDFLNDIVSFSGLESFIDLPIKTYSEGMCARLIFSMLTSSPQECLAIDEGFGTGDADFFERAQKRLQSFMDSATTLILASHSETLLKQFCNRGLVFNQGLIIYDGPLDAALNYYHSNDYYKYND